IVGMSRRHADNMRRAKSEELLNRLRSAAITGFFRPFQLEAAGLTRDQLPALLRSGADERICRGLYRIAAAEPTEHFSLAMACARVPTSIVSLLSALRVRGIGAHAPAEVSLAIPHMARGPR